MVAVKVKFKYKAFSITVVQFVMLLLDCSILSSDYFLYGVSPYSLVFMWVSSEFSGFLPPSKNMPVVGGLAMQNE